MGSNFRQHLQYHDDVIKWKHFPRYLPFVQGIHQSPVVPLTKVSDPELWCFLWSLPEQADEQTIEMPVIWDSIELNMTSQKCSYDTYLSQHIKCPSFCRRHLAMHFLEWKICILIKIQLKFVPNGLILHMSALVHVIASHWIGHKPISELLTKFCETISHH